MQVITGNKAVILGALRAGANYYAGYPITPSSEIMEYWSNEIITAKSPYKLNFLQTEDEISAIHSIIGASLAGATSFTATSGPGFSLMQEGIGLAFTYQTPIVIIDSQRVGPSTGMPTLTAQGDIMQTQYGSHGDYKSVVFYPNSVKEAYELTIKAFDTAQKVSGPVILLLDAFVSHIVENVDLPTVEDIFSDIKNEIDSNTQEKDKRKYLPLAQDNHSRYFSGLTTKDNLPETKDPEAYKKWITERLDLYKQNEKDLVDFELYSRGNAENLIIAFGGLSRLLYEIIDGEPTKYDLFRPKVLFPIPSEQLKSIANRYKNIFVLEQNQGQYANALRAETLLEIKSIPCNLGGYLDIQEIRDLLNKYTVSK